MRLIDADALKAELIAHHDFFINAYGGFKNLPANDKSRVDEITACIANVVNAPTIEAEPVVRCKDCEFARREKGMSKGYRKCVNCINAGSNQWRSINDFCSYGWKKEARKDAKAD